VHARLALIAELRPHVAAAYADLAGAGDAVGLVYRGTVPIPDAELAPDGAIPEPAPTPGIDALRESMLVELIRVRQQELDRGISLVGPHRDDLELVLGNGPAKGYASHGESWSFALALRLGSFALLRSDGVDPILVLDDVFAELDTTRRDRLAALVADAEQVVMTAAVPADVPEALAGVRLSVTDQGVTSES
jgi:DNA replication and repair protein RecF